MELPEDNKFPDDSWGVDESLQLSSSPDTGDIEFAQNRWNVEVVQGQAPDAANRLTGAVELLLAAAARSSE